MAYLLPLFAELF